MAEINAKRQNSIPATGLAYPERFYAAVMFVENAEDASLTEETKLLLYSLNQQATVGPCNEPRPWGWNVVNNAKWQSWRQLGDMPTTEAMRLYVRTLEEEIPDWFTAEVAAAFEQQQQEQQATESANGSAHSAGVSDTTNNQSTSDLTDSSAQQQQQPIQKKQQSVASSPKTRSVAEVVVEGSWVSPYIASDKRPPPRYEHAAALVGNQLFIIGGNCGGRYLADCWSLNLENLAWSPIAGTSTKDRKAAAEAAASGNGATTLLPPVAGHIAVPWNGNVVVIGGHSKLNDAYDEMPVRYLDVKSGTWSLLETSVTGEDDGEGPIPRGGHSGTLINNKVYVFGGEDPRRKLTNEMWTLDLTSLTWSKLEVAGDAPSARAAHSAVPYRNRYILFFGGGSVATCYNDLVVFDTQTLAWSIPHVEGSLPPPRAGHAAAVLGHVMYMVGGGNNNHGCADMWAMDLSTLDQGQLRWTLVGNTPADSAIAAEGLSLLPVAMAGCLVSYGGYNGRYHNALHVYRPEGYVVVKAPRGGNEQQAAATSGGPPGSSGKPGGGAQSSSPPPSSSTAAAGSSPEELAKVKGDLEVARREAATAKETVHHELAIMRRQLDAANAARSEAESALEVARADLESEKAKSMRLEVEAAELRQQLASMNELERELQKYQERDGGEGRKSGLWGYISGSDVAKA